MKGGIIGNFVKDQVQTKSIKRIKGRYKKPNEEHVRSPFENERASSRARCKEFDRKYVQNYVSPYGEDISFYKSPFF